jgi:hypothetical protein
MAKNILIKEQQLETLLQGLFSALLGKKPTGDLIKGLGGEEEVEVDLTGMTDEDFYKKLLSELGAPTSKENLKFLYAWRQSEGKAGKYNPFNTTHKMPNATNFNSVGVKNYASIEDGLNATLKTLKNGRYNCIVNGLKNDIGAKKISTDCLSELKTWGTGELLSKVVTSYEKGAKPKPSSLMA